MTRRSQLQFSTRPARGRAADRLPCLVVFGGQRIVSKVTDQRIRAMRWFHLAVIFLFVAAIVLFAIENFQAVSFSFLRMSIRMPLAFLVAIIYVLGALTGGALLTLLRRSYEGARR